MKTKRRKPIAKKARTPARRPRARARPRAPKASRWIALVAKHGVVLASARGPLPNIAELVAGELIVGSWWAHPKGKAIFKVLSELDDCGDIRCFKLVDGKVTLVHRRAWPALVRLGRAGILAADRLASHKQEHLPTGEHRNVVTPFPDWVDAATAKAADALTIDRALAAFPTWLKPRQRG